MEGNLARITLSTTSVLSAKFPDQMNQLKTLGRRGGLDGVVSGALRNAERYSNNGCPNADISTFLELILTYARASTPDTLKTLNDYQAVLGKRWYKLPDTDSSVKNSPTPNTSSSSSGPNESMITGEREWYSKKRINGKLESDAEFTARTGFRSIQEASAAWIALGKFQGSTKSVDQIKVEQQEIFINAASNAKKQAAERQQKAAQNAQLTSALINSANVTKDVAESLAQGQQVSAVAFNALAKTLNSLNSKQSSLIVDVSTESAFNTKQLN